ncbi:glycoside hydrolase/phage tail family protein [Ponticaulis sp.]|uniref:baseplate multidomain protein megatron n=1 Tax=Ponticaulis sp. TaxID=2020902 RepID=UPI000B6EB791|nr:glycoside hydrolase/phage tail family protein [Ponticaulis sp.]MAI90414.1 hypothetical protein [Ponticaulis sp.]OUY00116.1 MAG: hypothetical protein CBB65_08240 [Hyphomonadaceae bacterium TMED5]|tara:strand:+ start:24075 stop:27920 length:3846 start_codon:yes stop_codon:yes gene_type:complete
MAQLVFAEAGARLGAAFLPNGFDFLGLSLSGAQLGAALGGVAGRALDGALAGSVGEVGQISGLTIMESREGTPIPKVFGRMRVGGQVIWATHLKERKSDRSVSGKGGPSITEYSYTISFAVALCEGEITGLDRVWANGEAISLAGLNYRLYTGAAVQQVDPLIEAIEGAAPAYNGLAYIVFEDFPLDDYGARLPQLGFEVTRPAIGSTEPGLRDKIRSVNFIPASGEWVYAPDLIRKIEYPGWETPLNRNSATGEVDVIRALDQLDAELPNVDAINLTLAWFGDDLRCGQCEIRPSVETPDRITLPREWNVAGQTRDTARLISQDDDGRPYYGGTPDDESVLAFLGECASRGLKVTISPFLLMDIPPDNGLTGLSGEAAQPAFPWRGRISSTGDKSASARSNVEAFFGSASATDFALENGQVVYSGPSEWSYRRFVLHYAMLAHLAGGVDRFLLGSELVGLTRLRDEVGSYPAVEALVSLAAEVRAILGSETQISYAADWTEYGAYVPGDGTGDVLFPLDAFWADSNVDFIGLDWYAPLSDWRDGAHLDAATYESIYDATYLQANIEGGEGYDWFYARDEDRTAQLRTAISDTAHGEDWIFRVKDIRNWWQSAHYERPAGVRASTPTEWVAQSKPISFVEIGCGAVDKGTNAPNVFVDPKSSESGLPPFSDGSRDDAIQSAALLAFHDFWSFGAGHNPVSAVYSAPMVEADCISVWAFDARPFPAFPQRSDIWSDGASWQLGHWLNGRLVQSDLAGFVAELGREAGTEIDVSGLEGSFHGLVINGRQSVQRSLSLPLAAYGGICWQSETGLHIANTDRPDVLAIAEADFAIPGKGRDAFTGQRQSLDHTPRRVQLTVLDPDAAYQPASYVPEDSYEGDQEVSIELPMALSPDVAEALTEHLQAELLPATMDWTLHLSPECVELEVGDLVSLPGLDEALQVSQLERAGHLSLALSRPVSGFNAVPSIAGAGAAPLYLSRPDIALMDLPSLPGREDEIAPWVAGFAYPHAGTINVQAGASETELSLRAQIGQNAVIGRLMTPLPAGVSDRMRDGVSLEVEFPSADLSSVSQAALLNGANLFAIETSAGWMVCGFRTAQLVSEDCRRLSSCLAGIGGTDDLAELGAETGARLVLLDSSVEAAVFSDHELGQTLVWQASRPGGETESLSFSESVSGRALLPLRPGHLRKAQNAAGDIAFSWTRRARHSADRWDVADVPMLEDELRFAVSIYLEGDLVRSVETNDTSWVYTEGMQSDDGMIAGDGMVSIAQISARIGPGVATQIAI